VASRTTSADSESHREFFGLSLTDLARARELFHVQLLDYPNVVGTALGRYLIRDKDQWPSSPEKEKELLSQTRKRKPPRRLDNSGVRSYSWPCLLVFVRKWIDYGDVEEGQTSPDVLVPKRLWLPDGRVVPVCVVEAAPVELDRVPIETLLFPGSFLGAGYPVAATVQGRFRLGTIGPLVTNGQRVFALTSRHVLGPAGSDVRTFVHGVQDDIGRCAEVALTRVATREAYPRLSEGEAYLYVDVGLIDVDELDRWTSVAYGIGPLAPAADAGSATLTLALIGRTSSPMAQPAVRSAARSRGFCSATRQWAAPSTSPTS